MGQNLYYKWEGKRVSVSGGGDGGGGGGGGLPVWLRGQVLCGFV